MFLEVSDLVTFAKNPIEAVTDFVNASQFASVSIISNNRSLASQRPHPTVPIYQSNTNTDQLIE